MDGSVAFDSGASQRRAWSASGCVSLLVLSLGLVACDGSNPPGQAAPGVSGSAGSNAAQPPSPSSSRLLPGFWAIVAAEMDATVLELDETGNGRGCQAGWAESTTMDPDLRSYAADFCGPVTGHVEGNHVALDLALTGFGGMHYAIDGTLSERGDRIGGVHRISGGVGPLNLTEPGAAVHFDRDLDPGPYPLGKPWPYPTPVAERTELITQVTQGPFEPGKRYLMGKAWTTIGGDLGEYLGAELSFEGQSPGNVTLHAGPVPATAPDMPVALTAHYVNIDLTDVTVEMPSGESFTLTPAPPEP